MWFGHLFSALKNKLILTCSGHCGDKEHPGVFVCLLQLWPGPGPSCIGAEGRITSQRPVYLSLLTCPTCLQSTIALSFGSHHRASQGCSPESHIQRATANKGNKFTHGIF